MKIPETNYKVFMFSLVILVSLVFLPAGCTAKELKGNITEAGSTTVQPIAEKLADAFRERYPNVIIKVDGGGSGAGIADASSGKVDIGAASRALTSADPALRTYLLGHDGIAIIVHPANPVHGLNKEAIIAIFSGKISNWHQAGGPDQPISLVTREAGSGTLTGFQDLVMGKTVIAASAVVEPSNGNMRTYVSTNPGAIGFLSVSYLDATVIPITVDGIAPDVLNCKSGKYPFVRPLYFLTRSEPDSPVREFLDFALSKDGQNIVVKEGYLSAN